MTNGSLNPYVFIVGLGRSGTTLLRRVVDTHPRSATTLLSRVVGAHPLITIPPESHWIPDWFEKGKGLYWNGQVKNWLVEAVMETFKSQRT